MRGRAVRNPILAATLALLLFGVAATGRSDDDDRAVPFAEAEIFVELNDTDGDLGLHASIDGDPWTHLEIEGPNEKALLYILSRGRLRAQGLTQLAFESAEPTFDELSPAAFFKRFPEGVYEIEGRGLRGVEYESDAVLSHVLAAPPGNILLSGTPAAADCDADPLPGLFAPVVIDWDPVTTSHPTIGRTGPVTLNRYQLFVEGPDVSFAIDLSPSVTEFEVPMGLTRSGEEYKFEIIAQTDSGNNTAVESCFEMH